MTKTVVGLYDDFASAERAARALVGNGFAREDISLVAPDATHGNQPPMSDQPNVHADTVADGTAAGAGTGAVIGGLAGLLLGIGALAIPGLGPLIAAGPLAAVLAGAGTGAIAGGLIGALVDGGLSQEQAEAYAEGVRRGGTLVMLRAPDERAADVARIMDQLGAIGMEQRAREWREQNPINQDLVRAGATGSTVGDRPDTAGYSRDPGEHTPGRQDWSTHDRDVAGQGTPPLTKEQLAGSSSGGETWGEWHGASTSSTATSRSTGMPEQAGDIEPGRETARRSTTAGNDIAPLMQTPMPPDSEQKAEADQSAPRADASSGAN